jgi:geranylgeranyl pyrophosphate synthase
MTQSVLTAAPVLTAAMEDRDQHPDEAVKQRVKLLGELVRRRLQKDWTAEAHLDQVCGYAVSAPGKFFRPILLLESASTVGGEIDRVLPAAAGAEGAHVASLVHDDIIDGDEVRRGMPAVHVAFGRDDALVGGDALIFYLFSALAECGRRGIEAARIVMAMAMAAEAGRELCRGQMLEKELRASYDSRVASYLDMVAGKTGALFRASCSIGAVLGGGSVDALGRYGALLGYAFQIQDDLLPYLSTPDVTGKPPTSDLANRRLTLPFLLCRAAAGAVRVQVLDELLTGGGENDIDDRFKRLSDLLSESGALDQAADMAARYCAEAIDALAALPSSTSKDVLVYFAESAALRSR